MTKRYYTTTKSGEEVEVDEILAKQLVAQGKKKVEDFEIEEYESPSETQITTPVQSKPEYAKDWLQKKNPTVIETIFPRASKEGTNIVQKAFGGLLDVTSIPGRTVASVIGAAGSKLGGADFSESFTDIMSNPAGDPNTNIGSQLIEGMVKDPFLPVMAATGVGIAPYLTKLPASVAAGVGGGIENLIAGAIERGVDPNQKIYDPGAAGLEFTLGTIFGAGGRKLAQTLKGASNIDIGNAILNTFTPTQRQTGRPGKLATLIEQGWGKDAKITREDRTIDPELLGKFLSEQSFPKKGIFPGESKLQRIPNWIRSESAKTGQEIERMTDEMSEAMSGLEGHVEDIARRLESGRDPFSGPTEKNRENVIAIFDKLIADKKAKGELYSRQEAESLKRAIQDYLQPTGEKLVNIESLRYEPVFEENLTPKQLKTINDFLYTEAKDHLTKGRHTREELAGTMREQISDIRQGQYEKYYGDKAPLLPKQYAALMDLDVLATKSPEINPQIRKNQFNSPPLTLQAARGLRSAGEQFAEARIPAGKVMGIPTREIGLLDLALQSGQAVTREPSRSNLTAADQRIIARAQDIRRFNPNDPGALSILRSYGLVK